MQRYKLVIQYDGTPYVDFKCKRMKYIQDELNKALKKMTASLHSCQWLRRDSGVHANGQVVQSTIQ